MLPSTTFPRGVSTLHTDASGTAPPDAFGPFRVLHQIGAGVLGPVFRAYQPDPGRLVAVKQFRLDLPPETAHRFVAALDRLIAADLTHLGIAAPLAAGLTDNSPYLALDFVAAESFDVVIRDYGPAPVTEALRIATQLGGALDFAAAVNVFHGALHPRDVLVSTDDTRVTGLGIAQALEQVGVIPPVRRPYTAPERVAGAPWDRRADTFSLAALVYEMLFGRRIAGVGRAAADAITPIEGTDIDGLRVLFARALAEDPGERFETALAFAEALHGAVSEPARPARSSKPRRKRDTDEAGPTLPPNRATRAGLPLEPEPDLPLTLAAGEPLALQVAQDDQLASPSAPANLAVPEPEAAGAEPRTTFEAVAAEPESQGHAAHEPFASLRHDVDRDVTRDDAPVSEPAFGDLDLRAGEEERYLLAESSSALPDARADADFEAPAPAVPGAAKPFDDADAIVRTTVPTPAQPATHAGSLSSVALEESRSGIWPIALALVVGLLVGFAFGYGAGTRDHANTGPQVADAAAPSGTPAATQQADAPMPPSQAPPASAGERPRPSGSPGAGSTAPPPAVAPAPVPAPAAPRARETAPPPRAAAETGRLLVRSSPAGARVLVDGRDAGVTPLTVPSLARGTHVVRLTHQGYVAAERRVRIRAAQPAQSIEVDLVATRAVRAAAPPPAPVRTSGSLMVDSRPAGARVFVDGKLVGTTPLLLDAVNAGDHAVRLELDGFSPWTTTTRVAGGERTRVSGSLEQR